MSLAATYYAQPSSCKETGRDLRKALPVSEARGHPKLGTIRGLAAPLDNRPEVCSRGWGTPFLDARGHGPAALCRMGSGEKGRHGSSPGAGHTPGKVSD